MFRYEAQWVMESGCKDVIKKFWREKFHYGDKWKNMNGKLDNCSRGLQRWRKKEVGVGEKELNQKTQLLETLQNTDGELDRRGFKKICMNFWRVRRLNGRKELRKHG